VRSAPSPSPPRRCCTAYFAALAATQGIAWTPHLWLGAIVFAGVAGWLLSYLVLPPRLAPGGAVTP
jgi:hypothetical protein